MPAASGRPVLGASTNPARVSGDAKFKRTDIGKPIFIYTFLKEGVTLKSLTVYNNTAASGPVVVGTKVSDTTIDGATASFNSSTLSTDPAFSATGNKTIRLAFVATFSDGLTLTNGAVLTVTP
ncbi:hypothetical protein FNW52_01710 [Flavobacterium sp. ZT3R18]|uniref:hypothetical protein n=1 Tax=Flavobacterium sp. ZT3R18 TaxID=2594429 RepID=UPI001179BA50|nr:hypothetical protein [Flavobacterium sp. ZT3R18]TRX38786.1 hypothetical protein FNW52_01710 [Flavobacterium sp. ZT3R18]